MPSYLVWSDGNPNRRVVSAISDLAAASIFLSQPASADPRNPEEAHAPACRVMPDPAPNETGVPGNSKPFWRLGADGGRAGPISVEDLNSSNDE
jgi:hypothetical protein